MTPMAVPGIMRVSTKGAVNLSSLDVVEVIKPIRRIMTATLSSISPKNAFASPHAAQRYRDIQPPRSNYSIVFTALGCRGIATPQGIHRRLDQRAPCPIQQTPTQPR